MAKTQTQEAVTAYLTGGMGNQLFIYAAGLAQSRRLGCPLYVDASHYLVPGRRSFALGEFSLSGAVIVGESPWAGKLPTLHGRKGLTLRAGKRNLLRHLRSYRVSRDLTVFQERGFQFDERVNSIRTGTTLSGYFQSWRYFDSIGDEIRKMLNERLDDAKTAEVDLPENYICLHVRRGDYVDPKVRSFHGMSGRRYFERATELVRRLGFDGEIVILSDEPMRAQTEVGDFLGVRVLDNPLVDDPFVSLDIMSRAAVLVTSNSSFSWWAGWLGRQSDQLTVCPRPWFANDTAAADLLLPEWITLDSGGEAGSYGI